MHKRLTVDEFITNAKKIHGDRYDYSRVNYVNNKIPVTLICHKHGNFIMRPDSHVGSKQGCSRCGIEQRSKNAIIPFLEILNRAIKIHGNKYTYFPETYIDSQTKMKIKCNTCLFIFDQLPTNHVGKLKHGCPRCANNLPLTTEMFVEKARRIHGMAYDYSESIYVNCYVKAKIKCLICNKTFEQRPNDHLNNHECPHCHNVYPLNTEEFVRRAIELHKGKYNYSQVSYINNRSKVNIWCNSCNLTFMQTPAHHLDGHGCPYCFRKKYNSSKCEKEFLDKLKIESRQVYFGKMSVDGYDPKSNTIYEFLGDYYHGNPEKFHPNDYNKTCHKTFGELYNDTFRKFKIFLGKNYIVKYIWETDWIKYKCGEPIELCIKTYE